MNDDDSARSRRNGLLQGMKIDLPSVVVKERVARQLDVLDFREKVEERVTRRRNQKFVAGITQRSKDVGIRFTGAGREENILGRNVVLARSVIGGDGLASGLQSLGIWFVGESRRVAQRFQNSRAIITEAAFRGIRNGQIKKRLPCRAMRCQRLAQPVRRQIPICSLRKHSRSNRAAALYPAR